MDGLSINVKYDGRIIWNPAMGIGQVFVKYLESLEPLAACDAGVKPLIPDDTYEVEPESLERFTLVLVDWYFSSNHRVYHELLGSVLKCCLVLLERTGSPIELDPMSEEQSAFAREVARHSRSMPA
jgi:hypothetical protein